MQGTCQALGCDASVAVYSFSDVSTHGSRERAYEGDDKGQPYYGQHVCQKRCGQRRRCLPPTARARARRLFQTFLKGVHSVSGAGYARPAAVRPHHPTWSIMKGKHLRLCSRIFKHVCRKPRDFWSSPHPFPRVFPCVVSNEATADRIQRSIWYVACKTR